MAPHLEGQTDFVYSNMDADRADYIVWICINQRSEEC
jgi:hypothetical protein